LASLGARPASNSTTPSMVLATAMPERVSSGLRSVNSWLGRPSRMP
jgi:hypothetical protein